MQFIHREADQRGLAEHGWLHAKFTFSFGNYYNPEHCGFQSLQVMNNDIIEPEGGFPMHPHKNAEIFTYVVAGELEHEDSTGNGARIKAGDFQYMSAGSGIYHSERNPSTEHPTELYQIWMKPNQVGGEPRYSETHTGELHNQVKLLFSGTGRENSTPIRQNAEFYFGHLKTAREHQLTTSESMPNGWIQLVQGSLRVNSLILKKADGLGILNQSEPIVIQALEESKFLYFKLS